MQHDPTRLQIRLGATKPQQLTRCQALKDAMANCMILLWENGLAVPNDPTFTQVALIYQEAAAKAVHLEQLPDL